MQIPMRDLVSQHKPIREELHRALEEVIDGGEFYRNALLTEFEADFARYCGTAYAVGTCSGTMAIHLALMAAGIGVGDEVITAPNSDIGTTAAISHAGARLAWVDIDERTFNIDPDLVEAAITTRTKAILPVHLYGLPADMDPIMRIAHERGLIVIEDAALATGARYHGQMVGSLGSAGCFSFASTKILGALGSGGIVTTSDRGLAERVAQWASYGEPAESAGARPYRPLRHIREGYNVGLGVLQAAFLSVKLEMVEGWIERRREIAKQYAGLLAASGIYIPQEPPDCRHVFRTYVVRVKQRDRVQAFLRQNQVETATHYVPPMHLQPVYRDLGFRRGSFPVTEKAADELLCLPIYPEMNDTEVERVASLLLQAVEECS
jgi:dTDP-4-amino-4,6-dideoxygalactose transaminase